MPISLQDIETLRAKIIADRRKLEEQEQALRVLEEMLSGEHSSTPPEESPLVDTRQRFAPFAKRRMSLKSAVEAAVKSFEDQEFTVADVESILQQRGEMPNSKSPRASIAMALASLEEKGIVDRTYKGAGSEPHKFKYNSAYDLV